MVDVFLKELDYVKVNSAIVERIGYAENNTNNHTECLLLINFKSSFPHLVDRKEKLDALSSVICSAWPFISDEYRQAISNMYPVKDSVYVYLIPQWTFLYLFELDEFSKSTFNLNGLLELIESNIDSLEPFNIRSTNSMHNLLA